MTTPSAELRKGVPQTTKSPDRYQLQFMEDYEEARNNIIQTAIVDSVRDINNEFPYKFNTIGFTSSNVVDMDKMWDAAPKHGMAKRTTAENKSLSKGVAYQCNVVNRGKELKGYDYRSSTSTSDITLNKEKTKEYIDNLKELQPYRWKDTFDNRNKWRLDYSWCTGLPLCFDSDVYIDDDWKAMNKKDKTNVGKLDIDTYGLKQGINQYKLVSNENKPQCEHKDPLYQQVYFGAGPVTPLEIIHTKRVMDKKGWKSIMANKFMKTIKKMSLEAAKKIASYRGNKQKITEYDNKLKGLINTHAGDIKTAFGSDKGGDTASIATTTAASLRELSNQPITKRMRTWYNFIIHKYLIRYEKYAWEYRHVNEWAKNKVLFMNINFGVNDTSEIKYEPSMATIESFINKMAWCKKKDGTFHKQDGIVEMWARIATNIVRVQSNLKNNNDFTTSKIIEKFRLSLHTLLPANLKNEYKINTYDNSRFHAKDVIIWCKWEDIKNNPKTDNNEGVISFINSCLGGKSTSTSCYIDMGSKNLCQWTGESYNKKYIKANILNQSYFGNVLFNYSLNTEPSDNPTVDRTYYGIKKMGIDEGQIVMNDQGLRNMLHFNYLRCKRLVKKYEFENKGYNMDKFKNSKLFTNLKNINSTNQVKREEAQKYLRENIINPNDVQSGGSGSSSSSINKNFIDTFFVHNDGYEGVHVEIYDHYLNDDNIENLSEDK